MKTHFAPAERSNSDIILKEFDEISSIDHIHEIINALPYIGAILNEHRQIVFANENLLNILGLESFEYLIGNRPGEAIKCKNAQKEIGGCGTSAHCKSCGAVNAILKSQELKTKQVYECEISSEHENDIQHFSFRVTAAPFKVKDRTYTIFSMVDISSEKRKQLLERIFFHDILNRMGSLRGFVELLKCVNTENKLGEYIKLIEYIENDLIEEIQLQRDIVSAENGNLVVRTEKIHSKDILESLTLQIEKHEIASEKKIIIDNDSIDTTFISDPTLLKRILFNMLKNALEAISSGEIVTIGCKLNKNKIRYWVHNHTFIPNDVQSQIFYRSFSTKGRDRGLGTYSMKLLGEKYLKGKVRFKSEKDVGTIFYLELPITE